MMKMQSIGSRAISFLLLTTMLAMCGPGLRVVAAVEGVDAAGILQATGVQGGLIVHVGCADGKTTASLLNGEGYLVQGLAARSEDVDAARRHIRSLDCRGRVSIEAFDGKRLPYAAGRLQIRSRQDGSLLSEYKLSSTPVHNGVAVANKAVFIAMKDGAVQCWR